RGLVPAAEFGNTGGAWAENDVQEPTGDGQADAFGLSGGGELRLAVLVHNHRVVEASLQVGTVGPGLFELLAQGEDFLAVRLRVEVGADGVGLAVDGLPAEFVFVSEVGDGA